MSSLARVPCPTHTQGGDRGSHSYERGERGARLVSALRSPPCPSPPPPSSFPTTRLAAAGEADRFQILPALSSPQLSARQALARPANRLASCLSLYFCHSVCLFVCLSVSLPPSLPPPSAFYLPPPPPPLSLSPLSIYLFFLSISLSLSRSCSRCCSIPPSPCLPLRGPAAAPPSSLRLAAHASVKRRASGPARSGTETRI